jgi:phosphatidylinositol glycan class B
MLKLVSKVSNHNFEIFTLSLATIIYGITAYFSIGFYHADEHYQLIEFANMRLGNSPAEDLPWEYNAKIRPTLQVVFAMIIIKVSEFFSINNPFTQAFLLRFITAVFSIIAISLFVKKTKSHFTNPFSRKVYIFLSFFLWFLPYLSVRYSSEIWSGLFFLSTLILYQKESKNRIDFYWIGVLAGLSFLFRYQLIFALLGLFLWSVLIQKDNTTSISKSIISFAFICAIGLFIDSWFYNSITITPYNYFYKNIVESVSSNYGVSPWYYYIYEIIYSPYLFVGLPLCFALVFFFIKKTRNRYTWILIPFILVHSFIGHKEIRFLFPLIFLSSYILTFCFDYILSISSKNILLKLGISTFLIINLFLATFHSFKANGRGRLAIVDFLYKNSVEKETVFLKKSSYLFDDPISPHNFPMNFYNTEMIVPSYVENFCDKEIENRQKSKEDFVLIEYKDLFNDNCLKFDKIKPLKVSLPIPKSILKYLITKKVELPKIGKMLLLYKLN